MTTTPVRTPQPWDGGRRASLGLLIALAILAGVAAGAGAFATRGLFEALNVGEPLDPAEIAALIGAAIGVMASRFAASLLGEQLGQSYALDIREALFSHATRMGAAEVSARRAGYVALRFAGDMNAFASWPTQGLAAIIAASIHIPAAIIALWLIEPLFGPLALMIFAFAAVAIIGIGLAMRPTHTRLRTRRAAIAADMAERMGIAPDLGRFGRTAKEIARLRGLTASMIGVSLRRIAGAEGIRTIAALALAGLAVAMILTAFSEGMGTATLAAGLAAGGFGAAALTDLATAMDSYTSWRAASAKLDDALARPVREEAGSAKRLRAGPPSVSVKGRIPCKAEAGEITRLCASEPGAAAALLSAIAGRERTREGEIRIGGVPLEAIPTKTLRQRVGYHGLDLPVLKGSLRRAATFGLTARPDDDAVRGVLVKVGLEVVLDRIGLDGDVGEGAGNLTFGERRRLGVARLLLGTADLLLIDAEALPMGMTEADVVALCSSRKATVVIAC